jgi:SAM-dependent methyltransferase
MISLQKLNDLCRVFSDATRIRLLALLAHETLTVAELTEITGLAQSRVSTHLARLREAGLVEMVKRGSASYYEASRPEASGGEAEPEGFPAEAQVWATLQSGLDDPIFQEDRARAQILVNRRSGGGESWAETVAGQMERHYSPGRTWEAAARGLVGLSTLGRVVDIASGDGAIAQLLLPRAQSVTGVDISQKLVEAGRSRFRNDDRVELLVGDMHALPLKAASFDQALLLNALPFTQTPDRVFEEAFRVLRPGGRLSGATIHKHRYADEVEAYNHLNLGFEVDEICTLLENAGLKPSFVDITHRERQKPHFQVITFYADRPEN